MLKYELDEAIVAIEIAVRNHKGLRSTTAHRTIVKGGQVIVQQPDVLTVHRCEQINRILRWASHNWDKVSPEIQRYLYPERFK